MSLCYTDYIFIIYCPSLPFLWHDTCQTQAYQCPCFAVTFKVEALTSSLISTDLQSAAVLWKTLAIHVQWDEWRVCSGLMSVFLTVADSLKGWMMATHEEEWQFYSPPDALTFFYSPIYFCVSNMCLSMGVHCLRLVCILFIVIEWWLVWKTKGKHIRQNISIMSH